MTSSPRESGKDVPVTDRPARKRTPSKARAAAGGAAVQPAPVAKEEVQRLIGGAHHNPHSILGAHLDKGKLTIRTLRPDATAVTVLMGDQRHELQPEFGGVWATVIDRSTIPDYQLEVVYDSGTVTTDDPYRWLPTLGEVDLHLISEGRHEQLWDVLGAHVRTYDAVTGRVTGTSFAVWAPGARGVRVAGEFNYWDSRAHPMRVLGSSGVWEIFIPGVGAGTRYKFHVLGADSVWREKADPMAFATEVPPAQAS